ncbi:ABC transporter substrate-binding protein [Thermomonospora amylolytica]|uniref:ABC transporter substrate-binding protein n=1 Tax=Thermomonospora amylolytica TaxID=1411117 RepID=UPI000E6BF7BF|nr:ABC transporter substrate-binding protein [Thermomonospora amylolytica]
MPRAAALAPGDPERVGAYRLAGRLGEGGQGTVYLAENAAGEPVAVKVLHARLADDPRARARFAAELKVAQRVSGFCTARILDADVAGQVPYIVSEYIDGPSLQAVLAAEGPRSGPALVRVAIGTITALAAIHDAGIVHRDVKPSNVLLAADGPRLIDFGIARALDATGTLSSTAVGTPAYMAPEQISGHRVGPEADVFAWGATMVYAATGRPPFGQDSIPAVMHRILTLPPELGALPGPLRDIVALCLAKDPAQRPAAHAVLLQLLQLAGALPAGAADAAQRPVTALEQGAQVAADTTPPTLPPAPPGPWTPPYNAGWAAPPPGPPPPGPGTDPGLQKGAAPRRRGVGVLAGSAAAAVVALVLVGTFAVIQFRDRPGSEPTEPVKTGGHLRMAMTPPTGLNPSTAYGTTDRLIVRQLFSGLVEYAPDGRLRNLLASRIGHDGSCRRWIITLRSGGTFTNGEAVDAEALLRGWTRAARAPESLAGTLMGDIDGYGDVAAGRSTFADHVESDGRLTVTVPLKEPDCEFPKRLADPMFYPLPQVAGEHDNDAYNKQPIGNGPFRLTSYQELSQAVLVRNDQWMFGKAALDRVTVSFVTDPQAAVQRATAGEADWAEVPSNTLTRLAAVNRSLRVVKRPAGGSHMLVPITTRGPMRDPRARQALSLALDRRQISQAVFGGHYPPATGLVPSGIPGFTQGGGCPLCRGPDIERAERLAAEAGLGSGTRIDLHVREGSVYAQWTEAVRAQVRSALGWDLRIVLTPTSEFFDRIRDDDLEGLIAMGWLADYPSAYSFLQPTLGGDQTDDSGGNYGGWRNAGFDRNLRLARESTDEATATGYLRQAEQIAAQDMARIPIVDMANVALAGDGFTGLRMDPDGVPPLAEVRRR